MKNKKNVVLTGLMGAGKSCVGKLLARKLGFVFIDIDELIVQREKSSVNDIFEQKSESYFRKLESETIKSVVTAQNQVISIGGGAFELDVNRENLLNNSTVFYLKASLDTLYNRIKSDNSRPLLKCDNPKQKLETLLKTREPNYLKADYVVLTDNKSPDDVTDEIIRNL